MTKEEEVKIMTKEEMIKLYDLKKEILEKMERRAEFIENLPDDWDTEGAKKINHQTINLMKEVTKDLIETLSGYLHLLPFPSFGPVGDGTIDICFRKKGTIDLLINITGESKEEPEEICISLDNWSKVELTASLPKTIVIDVLSMMIVFLLKNSSE